METPEIENLQNNSPSLLCRMKMYCKEDGKKIDHAIGRDIGFEFARVGMKAPEDCPNSVMDGFKEGYHIHGRYHDESSKYERKLIRLRLSAFKRNRVVDPMLTPEFLSLIDVKYCPITRIELTSGTGTETDATVDRVFNGGGYAIGNITVMSQKANKAKGTLMPMDILEKANTGDSYGNLKSIEWMRLACLTSLAAPPGYPQTHLPLFVYPPNGILISNGYTLIQQCASAICAGYLQPRWEAELRNSLHGKNSKKRFSGFMEGLIGQVSRRLRGISNTELQWFGICDSWEIEFVFDRYKKLLESMTKEEVRLMINVAIRAQQSLKRISEKDLESWSVKTKGYTK